MKRALDIARALEARDHALAEAVAELAALAEEAEAIRARAAHLQALLDAYPDRRSELARRREEAAADVERCRREERAAEAALARVGERGREQERAEAERAAARARQAVAAARATLGRIEHLIEALDAERAAAEQEVPELEGTARRAASRLQALPRVAAADPPGAGTAGIADWGSRARGALLLARGSLEREREAVVREANEMGAALLGDPLFAGGTSALRRRLEGS